MTTINLNELYTSEQVTDAILKILQHQKTLGFSPFYSAAHFFETHKANLRAMDNQPIDRQKYISLIDSKLNSHQNYKKLRPTILGFIDNDCKIKSDNIIQTLENNGITAEIAKAQGLDFFDIEMMLNCSSFGIHITAAEILIKTI